jgi:predicted GH43/DUF377 family glycosyl hydrolase
MRWRKRGLVFAPAGRGGWMLTHAQVPTVLPLDDRLRVYFASRPRPDLSLTAFVDLDRDDPARVIGVHETPILELGRPGTFDADGVMPSCAVRHDNEVWLYYSGWSRLAGRAPYNNATGLAVSSDGGVTFTRRFVGPILDRAAEEPWSATSPEVVRDGARWRMCYSSGVDWIEVEGKLEHVYVIKSATSNDGLAWRRNGRAVLPVHSADESQTRPAVCYLDGWWHMWFAFRGSRGFRDTGATYRIGYARSRDLAHWERDDEAAGIAPSATGWDQQMIAYPSIAIVGERVLMFYNGNGFGADGFGYAELER